MLIINHRRHCGLHKALHPLTYLILTIWIILSFASESSSLKCYDCPNKHACDDDPHLAECGVESHCIKVYWYESIDREENYLKKCDFALGEGCETNIEEPTGGTSAKTINCACNDKDFCNGGRASMQQSPTGMVSLWILSVFLAVITLKCLV